MKAKPCLAKIDDAFWTPKLNTLFSVTLPDTLDKLEKDGAVENYRRVIAGEGEHLACPWHDGLLLETLRGASDYLYARPDEALAKRMEGYAEVIERAQTAAGGGYLSTYTLLDRPNQRFGENGGSILWQHDLYNCGALFEAGAHVYRATGSARLLGCALRCANDLADTIGPAPKKWIVPGHSLAEYALLELYRLCREDDTVGEKTGVPVRAEAYLALAEFWVRGRGRHEMRTNHPAYMGEYAQDHAPIEDQARAVGHAVRATLYYTGAARLADELGDAALLSHVKRLWDNVVSAKLYVNGGVGATHFEEKFGEDYSLPNEGYMETCATVGMALWADAMHAATGEARYYDTVERALYNLMLSSVTLQGDGYFYRNPMSSKGDEHHWTWHSCPCCPPMIHKLFGQLDRMIYSESGDGLNVNLYIAGSLQTGGFKLRQRGNYPWSGEIRLLVDEAPEKAWTLRLRKPEWAERFTLLVNGAPAEYAVENGYLALRRAFRAGDEVTLSLPMAARRVEAHPYVREDRGRVALMRGPIAYCLEGVDNNGETDVELAENPEFEERFEENLLGGVIALSGLRADGKRFKAVPLYAWDNRAAGAMNVWLRQRGKDDGWSASGWEGLLYRTYRA